MSRAVFFCGTNKASFHGFAAKFETELPK